MQLFTLISLTEKNRKLFLEKNGRHKIKIFAPRAPSPWNLWNIWNIWNLWNFYYRLVI